MNVTDNMQRRTEILLGTEALLRIRETRVLIIGVGGVGSWCAESLIRSGICHLTIVDSDCVEITNCNRQLMATSRTIGRPKVEALRERLLEICPTAVIEAVQQVYNADTAESFHLAEYDYIVDAIDSVRDKADLILRVTALPKSTTLVSSMGAALRLDPFRVQHAEFWNVKGDALARALRERFKRDKHFPARKFQCVYSDEQAHRDPTSDTIGSLCPVTATFGMALSGLILNHIISDSYDRKITNQSGDTCIDRTYLAPRQGV